MVSCLCWDLNQDADETMGRGRAGRKCRREEAEEIVKEASAEGVGEGGVRGKSRRREVAAEGHCAFICVLQGEQGAAHFIDLFAPRFLVSHVLTRFLFGACAWLGTTHASGIN